MPETEVEFRLDIAPCISCKRMTPRSRAFTVEDFEGGEIFLCVECDAEMIEADQLAAEVELLGAA